ncbi:MAG: hypothetical protein U1G07_05255 [Verrucomicrobiota bacterium]
MNPTSTRNIALLMVSRLISTAALTLAPSTFFPSEAVGQADATARAVVEARGKGASRPLPDAATRASLGVDFARPNGLIRALHGVNLGPLCYRGMVDLSRYHQELRLPLTRLHDVVWLNYDAVDISTIFRDFRNDPTDAANYQFEATDDYIAAIVKAGSPILYRLGESIEHTPRKYRVHPPSDPIKWAEICCAIIRHYNEGWASGFHHNIRYWEIWNEPENQPAMWTGTDEQFLQLYEVTAKAIKARWPDLKVGGPSFGYTGELSGEQLKPGAFLLAFLSRCRDRRLPLDFFSWHRYTKDPAELGRRAKALRQLLDAYGFAATESHLNEWNYLPKEDWHPITPAGQGQERERWETEMGGAKAAAFAAWALLALQDAPLDMANFYTAEVQAFGMFSRNGVPRKTYQAFRAFRGLLNTPNRVITPLCRSGQTAVCAGLNQDQNRAGVLLSQFEAPGPLTELVIAGLPWKGATACAWHMVDEHCDFDLVRHEMLPPDGRLRLPEMTGPSVVLLTLMPHESRP